MAVDKIIATLSIACMLWVPVVTLHLDTRFMSDEPLDYAEAKRKCEQNGQMLPIVDSQSDIEDIGEVISEFDPSGNTLVGSLIWIGNKTNKSWEDVSLDDLTIRGEYPVFVFKAEGEMRMFARSGDLELSVLCQKKPRPQYSHWDF